MLPRSFNRTVHGHTHLKTQKQPQNLDGQFLPPTIVPRCCSPPFPPLWSPQRCQPWENLWKSWRGYWRSGSTKFKLVQEGKRCSCFSLTLGCWSSWRLCTKMKCVINTATYPMHIFKELCNKLLATNKLCCRTFGATFILYVAQSSNSHLKVPTWPVWISGKWLKQLFCLYIQNEPWEFILVI